jgi:hypothetical protein
MRSVAPQNLRHWKFRRTESIFLTPEASDKPIAAVPTVAGEQPGMGKATGAVVGGAMGGAMGVAGGAGLFPAIASLLVPGVGSRYRNPAQFFNPSLSLRMDLHRIRNRAPLFKRS